MKKFSSKTRVNYPRNSKGGKSLKILIVIVAALVVLYLFGSTIGKLSAAVTWPVYVARSWLVESSASVPVYLRSRNELLRDMNALRERLSAQGGREAVFSRALHENSELRALLGVSNEERIIAGVTARPPYLPYDSLLIDRGVNDGVREGAIVYHAEDHAIGFISKAYAESALVTLFSTSGIEATAYIIGPDIYTTAYGEGGGVIRISVPQGILLSEGDTVIIPSLEMGIIGVISEIESVPTQPEQHASVVMDTPIQSLHLVGVSPRVMEQMSFEEAEALIHGGKYDALRIDVPPEFMIESTATSTATSTSATTTGTGE